MLKQQVELKIIIAGTATTIATTTNAKAQEVVDAASASALDAITGAVTVMDAGTVKDAKCQTVTVTVTVIVVT